MHVRIAYFGHSSTCPIYATPFRRSECCGVWQVEKWLDQDTGVSSGRLGRPDSLMRAVEALTSSCGVEAVAVVGRFPDDALDEIADYRQGQGVDVLAGVEAVISHTVVRHFRLPCAHAPALAPLPLDCTVAPRSAAEEVRMVSSVRLQYWTVELFSIAEVLLSAGTWNVGVSRRSMAWC